MIDDGMQVGLCHHAHHLPIIIASLSDVIKPQNYEYVISSILRLLCPSLSMMNERQTHQLTQSANQHVWL